MNAIDPRPAGHDAQAFLDLYEARKQTLPGGVETRDLSASLLRASGLPRRSAEAWKYTDLRPLTGLAFAQAPRDVAASGAVALLERLGLDAAGLGEARRLVFVNGRFNRSLSLLPRDVDVETGPGFAALARPERDALVALNTMLAEDGVRIHVRAGVDAGRLLLITLACNEAGEAISTHPRCSILIEEGARLSLLEVAHGEGIYLHNPVLEVEVRAGGHLAHVLWQQDSAEALHFLHRIRSGRLRRLL